MDKEDLNLKIKKANREVYNSLSPEEYNRNESIFNDERRKFCSEILSSAARNSGSAAYLDIGTGTGNLLRIAEDRFDFCAGTDISENLLSKIRKSFDKVNLLSCDAEYLPFRSESFNCVSCYALLHHLLEHEKLLAETARVLKPGGTLYTDHDPNYFFNRFYHLFYRLKYSGSYGFGSEAKDLSEYHNVFSPGINPEKIKKMLLTFGFREVRIAYRVTDNRNMGFARNILLNLLRTVTGIVPLKSFYTHFAVIAVK